jgi:hypothetical protein
MNPLTLFYFYNPTGLNFLGEILGIPRQRVRDWRSLWLLRLPETNASYRVRLLAHMLATPPEQRTWSA